MDQSFARENIRVVAVIQARMGSTRLPGKVLKPIAGKPLLWHIVHRLKGCHLLEDIAVATSVNPADEAIVEWCKQEGVTVVRGPEDDVLARFASAAEKLDADIIVRVSSDAPFIDAGFVDHLVATLIEQDGDYVLLEEGAETAHVGVDPFSRRALDRLMMDAANDPAAKEHVTGYFKLNPGFVKIVRAAPYPRAGQERRPADHRHAGRSGLHRSPACPMDARAGEASLADLLLLLEREPELNRSTPMCPEAESHGAVRRPGADPLRWRRQFGYGHVKRMVALARAFATAKASARSLR